MLSLELFIAFAKRKERKKSLYTCTEQWLFPDSIIEAHTIVGADVATFALIDDRTLG